MYLELDAFQVKIELSLQKTEIRISMFGYQRTYAVRSQSQQKCIGYVVAFVVHHTIVE